jgi:dihydroneopterin aldolase/D-erythro-7,8-dihydroneopterin triphosphate epimerase
MTDARSRPAPDEIRIGDLQFRCVIGVDAEERREKQDVVVQIVLGADLSGPCHTDDIGDTVDYKQIKKKILRTAEGSTFHLIEALAQRIADICLEDERIERVEVTVEKPGALRFARTVAVRIVRDRCSNGA